MGVTTRTSFALCHNKDLLRRKYDQLKHEHTAKQKLLQQLALDLQSLKRNNKQPQVEKDLLFESPLSSVNTSPEPHQRLRNSTIITVNDVSQAFDYANIECVREMITV